MIYNYTIFRFSDIFYIDATSQQTLEADLIAITPINMEQSVAACHQWLASQHETNWLLFFDNADDVQLNLGTFFPKCRCGNILVTTRNPQLSLHAEEDADAKIADMDPEDAKCLLMKASRAEKTGENEKLAALIVKVPFIKISLIIIFMLMMSIESPLFCISHLSSWCLHSSLFLTQEVSRALSRAS